MARFHFFIVPSGKFKISSDWVHAMLNFDSGNIITHNIKEETDL